MRTIKLTETEWKYINEALIHAGDFVDSWEPDKFSREWNRKIAILKRAEHKVATAKREK